MASMIWPYAAARSMHHIVAFSLLTLLRAWHGTIPQIFQTDIRSLERYIRPFKGLHRAMQGYMGSSKGPMRITNTFPYLLYLKDRILKSRLLAFSPGAGGFRKLREACRNHFHLSCCLSGAVVTIYSQKPYERIEQQLYRRSFS